jgi:3D (Asp-Asp-Asp) domain-containing protein
MLVFFGEKTNALENKKNVVLKINGETFRFKTNSETIKEFFIEQNIEYDKNDCINHELSDELSSDNLIEIKKKFNKKISIDGIEKEILVQYDDAVSSIIEKLNKKYNKNFVCKFNINTKIQDIRALRLLSKQLKNIEREEIIDFNLKINYTNKMVLGEEKIIQDGVVGKKVICEEILLLTNKEVGKKVVSQKIVVQPRDKIILKGTHKKKYSGEYKQAFVMNATAYTAGYESTGKKPGDVAYGITSTGSKVCFGTVAVDPSFIKLGSKLYVEGYGSAIASDTGGAIKGNKIDLYYDRLADAKKFGRRELVVYLLD